MKTQEIVLAVVIGVLTTVLGALIYDRIKTRQPLRVLNFPIQTAQP